MFIHMIAKSAISCGLLKDLIIGHPRQTVFLELHISHRTKVVKQKFTGLIHLLEKAPGRLHIRLELMKVGHPRQTVWVGIYISHRTKAVKQKFTGLIHLLEKAPGRLHIRLELMKVGHPRQTVWVGIYISHRTKAVKQKFTGLIHLLEKAPGRLHIRLELMKVGHPTTDCLGGNIYFTSNQSGKTEIYRFNTFTGEGARQMTYTFGAHESWSPVIRGHNIYFTSNRSGVTQIYRLTRNEVAITDFESWDREIN